MQSDFQLVFYSNILKYGDFTEYLPFPGSDRQKDPIFSPVTNGATHSSNWAGVPFLQIGLFHGEKIIILFYVKLKTQYNSN